MHPVTTRPGFASDADLAHPWAAQYRIPLVTSTHPRWLYEVAVVVPRADDQADERYRIGPLATWPTDDEAAVIGSLIDYRRSCYRSGWAAAMLRRPLDVDDSTNTIVLVRADYGWAYRRASFHHDVVPRDPARSIGEESYPHGVEGLLRLLTHRVYDIAGRTSPTWATWMADHPDTFDTAVVESLVRR